MNTRERVREAFLRVGNPRGEFTLTHGAAIIGMLISFSWIADGLGAWLADKWLWIPGLALLTACAAFLGRAVGRPRGGVSVALSREKTDVIVILSSIRDGELPKLATPPSNIAQSTLLGIQGWGTAFRAVSEFAVTVERVHVIVANQPPLPDETFEVFARHVSGPAVLSDQARHVNVLRLDVSSTEDFSAVQEHVERVFATHGHGNVTVDVTGGTKLLSFGALLGSLDERRQATYVKLSGTQHELVRVLSSREQVAGAG